MTRKPKDAQTQTKKADSSKKVPAVAVKVRQGGNSDERAIRQANAAIRLAEIQIAKGKRTGQGIGSVRVPGGAGKKK